MKSVIAHARPAALTLDAVSVTYGGVRALSDVSIAFRAGITSIVGPNGAGKSTAVNVASGLVRPTSGRVVNQGGEVPETPQRLARYGVARTFQTPRLLSEATVLENLGLGLATSHMGLLRSVRVGAGRAWVGLSRHPDVVSALEATGLADHRDRAVATLSYGQRRMVEVARALVRLPRVLLLDEPAAGLNARETETFGELVRALVDEGVVEAVGLIEHDLDLVLAISAHLVVLDQGRVIAAGVPELVVKEPIVVRAYTGIE